METPSITITDEQRQEVERQLRRTDLTPRVRERLEMVKAAALGDDVARIARWSGRGAATVARWLAGFAQGGVAALADAPRPGRPARADAAYLAALETALETPPRALGLGFDVWTSARVAAYLEQQTGVGVSPGWLRALLAQRGGGCGRPKHTLKPRQDPAAVAASRAELAAAGEKDAGGAGALRTALPGRDPSGDQSRSLPDLAPARPATDATRNRRDPRSGPIAASRCLAASRPWAGDASSASAPPRIAPGSSATWNCWPPGTRRWGGRSSWPSTTARPTPASRAAEPWPTARAGSM
jgi:transposase